MKKFNFQKSIIIKDNFELQKIFGNENILLEDNSSLELKGFFSISQNIIFKGKCVFGNNVTIHNGSVLENVKVGSNSIIRPYSILINSNFGENNLIGPFCFVRDNTNVENYCIVGSHVEIARSFLENRVKISHQSYIGDAFIGCNTIIGAGTVFCNDDGAKSQKTVIGEKVIIGSGSMIISPRNIGSHAIIGAGSVISKDILPNTKIIQKR